ncbi:hypothetical protein [Tolypothrix sp. NIES-4075]|uniref:hypothetical protein n=1 Tax=Tolypothrix sp. NIES-4075 TaxID=2005459 RepID=UPI00190EF1F8|nr:hypothetical protein [Tolypothrix sp. NIES-4075]
MMYAAQISGNKGRTGSSARKHGRTQFINILSLTHLTKSFSIQAWLLSLVLKATTIAQAGIRKDVDPKLLAEEKRIDPKEKIRFDIVNSPKIEDAIAELNY